MIKQMIPALLATRFNAKRPTQEEIPMEGAGVGRVKDKKLEEWGAEFIETRDKKAELATEMTALETKMLDRMREKGIEVFRFADQELRVKLGKAHVKVKKIKVEGVDQGEGEQQEPD